MGPGPPHQGPSCRLSEAQSPNPHSMPPHMALATLLLFLGRWLSPIPWD